LGEDMILAVENEVKVHPAFQEAILVLDESAEEKLANTALERVVNTMGA